MDSQDSKDRADELTEDERRRETEPSSVDSSIPKPSHKKFGFGKKCLIVFTAAVFASIIVHQLPDAFMYTKMDKSMGVDPALAGTWLAKTAHVLGRATAYFLMAMVIAVFVRGSTGAITGVVLVGVWAYFSGYGMLHNRELSPRGTVATNTQQQSTSARPIPPTISPNHAQSADAFLWKPTGSEYSVVFPGVPKISEVRGRGDGKEVTYLEATHSGADDFEQAQFFPRAADTSTTKEAVTAGLLNWARVNDIQYAQVEFNDGNPDDIVATLKGAKPIPTKAGNVTISYRGETHYGPRSVMITLIGAPTSKHPTPQGLAFLQSIRLER
jgi:hypothetical protein